MERGEEKERRRGRRGRKRREGGELRSRIKRKGKGGMAKEVDNRKEEGEDGRIMKGKGK